MDSARIIGIGSYLPERRLTNADLERLVDTSDDWILSRTGIRERRVAAEGEGTSDLAARALDAALADAGIRGDELDLLLLSTSSPDMVFPSTAALTQAKAGLGCPAADVMAACTGFIYALHDATAAIESGRARTVAVVGADAFTRYVDFTDRSTCVLFGDGAGAVILRAARSPGVLGIRLGANGDGSEILYVPGGGSGGPFALAEGEDGPARDTPADAQYVRMSGKDVFKFAVRTVPDVARDACRDSGLELDDIRWFVPHQANQRIIDAIADRLGVGPERMVSTIADTGNTSTASIPLAMDRLYTDGDLAPGDHLLLLGFGAGLTWGAAALHWTKEAR